MYVQHRLKERADEVNQLLEQKAYFYVCGDAANMAREVNTIIGRIISEKRGLPEAKGEEIVKQMRSSNLYQVGHNPFIMLQTWFANTLIGGCMVMILSKN